MSNVTGLLPRLSARGIAYSCALSALLIGGAALLPGCAQEEMCPGLGQCGGNPVGSWVLSGESCVLPLYQPPPQIELIDQPETAAGRRAPEQALSDWCGGMVYSTDPDNPLKVLTFIYESLPVTAANVQYYDDGTYDVGVTVTGRTGNYFSRTCLQEHGANPTCGEFQDAMAKYLMADPTFQNPLCVDDRGGCYCSVDVFAVTVDKGTYRTDGNIITHYSSTTNGLPTEAEFCASSDLMDLSGARGTSLFDRAGLRSLQLQRVNCSDGIQGFGEAGVDCGAACPVKTCP